MRLLLYKNKFLYSLVLIAVLAGGFAFGRFYGDERAGDSGDNGKDNDFAWRAGGYEFVNPLLECEFGEFNNNHLAGAKEKIFNFAEEKKKKNSSLLISVYYRDLNNGPTFRLGEENTFSPASLLKVPMMLAFYKLSEEDPGLLARSIVYQGEFEDKLNVDEESQTLKPGEPYEIGSLIRKMIVYSDNKSMKVLQKYLSNKIDPDRQKAVLAEIGFIMPVLEENEYTLTAKNYASLFRVLYNASYLNKTMSEKALALMSEADYDEGLAAGLPAGVKIANKFGYFYHPEEGDLKQLHDCGIIYKGANPYLLCVMTKGNDRGELAGIIKEISRLIYEGAE